MPGDRPLSDISEYLKERMVEMRFARFIGEIVWAIGSTLSITGLFLNFLPVTVTGFSLLFLGLYLSVHYELQRLNYVHALERFAHREK